MGVPIDRKKESWITDDFVAAYSALHEQGLAHSVEAWAPDGRLVGGLYGVSLGRMFFGESMFARSTNASKAAFIGLSQFLQEHAFDWIDCQHHESPPSLLSGPVQSPPCFLAALNHPWPILPCAARGPLGR